METTATRWWLYLLECEGGSIYTGISTDVDARYAKHVLGKGAKYTRAFPPLRILKTVQYADHSTALKAEHAMKKMSAAEKRLFASSPEPKETAMEAPDKASADPSTGANEQAFREDFLQMSKEDQAAMARLLRAMAGQPGSAGEPAAQSIELVGQASGTPCKN